MCAILDANVVHEVFQPDGPRAGKKFLEWLNRGKGFLVVGGQAHEEFKISLSSLGRKWARQAQLSGKLQIIDTELIEEQTEKIREKNLFRSDDPHILALAQVSGARLLYTNDESLQQDFKDKALIDNPRGKVYSTRGSKEFENSHRRLLANRNLCTLAGGHRG